MLGTEHNNEQTDNAADLKIIEELKNEGIPLSLFHRGGLLVLRGIFVSVIQYSCKRYVLAQKDDDALLAASGGMSLLEMFNFPLLFSSIYIVSTKVSASKGNPKKVGDLFRQGLLFSGLLLIPVVTLSLNAKSIFTWMSQPAVVVNNSRCYFSVSIVAYLFDTLYRLLVRVGMGVDDFHLGLIGDAAESIVDLASTYVLVNGKFGFSEMGVCASAWGYAIGAFAGLLSSMFYLGYTKKYEQYELLNFNNPVNWTELKDMISGGLHWACSGILTDITQMLITFVCGLSGHGPLIARQAASSYYNIETFLGDGVLEAGGVLIAPLHTLKETRLFHDVSFWVLTSVISFSILSAIFLLSNVSWAATFFFPSGDINKDDFEIVKSFLRVQAFICVINSAMSSFNYLLSGCNETKGPFFINTAFVFALNSILVGLAYFMWNQGAVGAFAIQMAGMILSATGQGLLWKSELRRASLWEKQTVDASSTEPPVVVTGPRPSSPPQIEMRRMMFFESPRRADQGFNEFFSQRLD